MACIFISRVSDTDYQAADPEWRSLQIHNANLRSHLTELELLPHHFMGERDYITCYDPANSLHIRTVIADNDREIRAKIIRARDAQETWAQTTFAERRRVMRSLLKWLVENQQECARVACRDTGKTRKYLFHVVWISGATHCGTR